MNDPGSVHKSEGKKFYPDYLSEIIVTILVCLELLLIVVLIWPPAMGREIDFLKPFLPRPEWYFLWLFELVGWFPGPTAVIGTVVIPAACAIALLLIPYIDRGKNGRLKATAVFTSLLLLFAVFTLLSLR